MSWSVWLAIAIIGTSVERVLNRFFLSESDHYWEYLLGYHVGAVAALVLTTSVSWQFPDAASITLLIVSGAFWFLGCYCGFKADQMAEVSTTALISQLQLILTFVGGILFFHESFSAFKVIGITLIIFGISARLKFSNALNAGAYFKILAAIAIGIAILLDKLLTTRTSSSLIALSGYGVPLAMALVLMKFKFKSTIDYTRRIGFLNIFTGCIGALVYYALIQALSSASVSIVMPVYQIHLVLTLTFAFIFLKERADLRVKLLTAIPVLAGAAVIQW